MSQGGQGIPEQRGSSTADPGRSTRHVARTLTLPALTPFSLPPVLRSHGWVRLAPFSADEDRSRLARIERLRSGRVVELVIKEASGGVTVEVSADLGWSEEEEVRRKVAWMLGLDQDLSPFYAVAREEPKLALVEERAQGRILKSPTLFEDVVKTILTTNTSWAGTIRMVEALVSQFGDPLPRDRSLRAFPTPGQLAALDEQTLRAVARLGYRAPFVLELARGVASGALDLEGLQTTEEPTEELRARLLEINGVGAYSAANLLIMLGRYDFIPVDSWARKLVSHEWYQGEPVRSIEVETSFERWGKWKGLAYWFWEWSYLAGE
jgi:3-methyladenine DNA glycosylase/8-oxoguanine DNA glycosylase